MAEKTIYDEEEEIIEDYDPHVDEVMRYIPEGISRETIEQELRENTEYYCLKISDAKRRTIRSHGGNAKAIVGDLIFTELKDTFGPGEYNIRGEVKKTWMDEYTKNGELKKKTFALIWDQTVVGEIMIWGECELIVGNLYAFKNCSFNPGYNNLTTNCSNTIDITPPISSINPDSDSTSSEGNDL